VDRFIIHQTIPLQFMQKIYVLIAAFSLFSHTAFAQLRHLNLNVSVNGGYSELLHKTDFRTTPLTIYMILLLFRMAAKTTIPGISSSKPIKLKTGLVSRGWVFRLC